MPNDIVSKYDDFDAVISIIETARGRALKAINAELIHMYRNVGEYLSDLCAKSSFGDKIIDEVAAYISEAAPTIKGFMLIGLTQHTTRCSNSANQTQEDLISGHAPVKAEAVLIKI